MGVLGTAISLQQLDVAHREQQHLYPTLGWLLWGGLLLPSLPRVSKAAPSVLRHTL